MVPSVSSFNPYVPDTPLLRRHSRSAQFPSTLLYVLSKNGLRSCPCMRCLHCQKLLDCFVCLLDLSHLSFFVVFSFFKHISFFGCLASCAVPSTLSWLHDLALSRNAIKHSCRIVRTKPRFKTFALFEVLCMLNLS